jgi:hypothetical protein
MAVGRDMKGKKNNVIAVIGERDTRLRYGVANERTVTTALECAQCVGGCVAPRPSTRTSPHHTHTHHTPHTTCTPPPPPPLTPPPPPGDGAITGGMAYEAMNHAGFLDSNMIIILNDNQQVGW